MRKFLHFYALAFLLVITLLYGHASEKDPVNDQDKAYFKAIRDAVLNDDKNWLVNEIRFPIKAVVQGERIKIKSKEDFFDRYDEIINSYVKNSVRDQDISDLFKDWKGLMIGRGAIWFKPLGPPNEDDGPYKYFIVAINNEPPEGFVRGKCSSDTRMADACYDVRGRLRINANMTPYLWPIGTRRLLGIAPKSNETNTNYFMPDDLAKMLNVNTDIFGNFRVCPFTPEKPGELQIVCIDSASNLQTSASNIPPNGETVEETVRTVVNIQANAVNSNSPDSAWSSWIDDKGSTPIITSIMQKYYTHDFIKIWKCAASTHEDVWDGDFIIGAQNVTSERLISVQPVKITENTALINANIEDQGEGAKGISHMQFSLRRENGAWKVDDIINLDSIAYNKKYKTPYMKPSQREALKAYPCN